MLVVGRCIVRMETPDIHKLLLEQQEALRELRTRVDFIAESFIILQGLLILQATDPEGLQGFSTEELTALLSDKQTGLHQKLALLDAARKRRTQPPPPPASQN